MGLEVMSSSFLPKEMLKTKVCIISLEGHGSQNIGGAAAPPAPPATPPLPKPIEPLNVFLE